MGGHVFLEYMSFRMTSITGRFVLNMMVEYKRVWCGRHNRNVIFQKV